jgi:hypothetical protein
MPVDNLSLDRLLIASLLAVLAVVVAFGPELGRFIARVRDRRIADAVPVAPPLGAEAQQS